MIFCLAPGRCGTGYLSHLLSTIPDVTAYHEPSPKFSENRGSDFRRFWLDEKLVRIAKTSNPFYAETSHCFKYFADSLLELDNHFDAIHISRTFRDVALSFWRRKSVPGRTQRGKQFLYRPDFEDWQKLTDYQLCYWHVLKTAIETERLAYYATRIAYVTFDDLVNDDGLMQICFDLQLSQPDMNKYEKKRTMIVNANPKGYYNLYPENIREQEKEVEKLW